MPDTRWKEQGTRAYFASFLRSGWWGKTLSANLSVLSFFENSDVKYNLREPPLKTLKTMRTEIELWGDVGDQP